MAETTSSTGNNTPQVRPKPIAVTRMALRTIYRFLERRRVRISSVAFTLILAFELLLGIGWHHANLRTDILFGVAVVLMLLGAGIRSWAAGTIRKNSQLATLGAYSLCRHPLYLGTFLMIAGVCIGTQPLINFPLVVPCIAVIYVCAIRKEEVKLAQLFRKDWPNYLATTPRLLPRLRGQKIRFSRWSLDQWRCNREYNAALATIAGIAGMVAWYVCG